MSISAAADRRYRNGLVHLCEANPRRYDLHSDLQQNARGDSERDLVSLRVKQAGCTRFHQQNNAACGITFGQRYLDALTL